MGFGNGIVLFFLLSNRTIMMATTTLDCRLLCACVCSYYIEPYTGTYNPPDGNPYVPAVGYLTAPKAFFSGTDDIDAALVGQNADGIIVAFRGTLPPSWQSQASLLDWLQDIIDSEPEARSNVPGKVHTGFYDAVMAIVDSVASYVKTLRGTSTTPVYVTGHSKGGPMASIGGYILHGMGIPITQVVTFASPKPGNGAFKQGYETVIPNQIRYENYDDIVPLLPPSDAFIRLVADLPLIGSLFKKAEHWDYEAVGTLRYIESKDHSYKIIPDNPLLMPERLAEIVVELGEDVIDWHFSSFGDAHEVRCGGGYMGGVCRSGVC